MKDFDKKVPVKSDKELNEVDIKTNENAFLFADNIKLSDEKILLLSLDEMLDKIIDNSFGAATAEGAFNTKAACDKNNKENVNNKRVQVKIYLKKLFKDLLNEALPKISYREWHNNVCEDLISIMDGVVDNNGNNAWTYGNSQKVLNLCVKYFVVLAKRLKELDKENEICKIGNIFIQILDELDIPVDSYIIEGSWNYNVRLLNENKNSELLVLPLAKRKREIKLDGKYNYGKVISWSNWDKDMYLKYVKSLHKAFKTPFNWEGYVWIKIKEERKKK